MNIPRISVVLNGAPNDKQVFVSAVRMAARECARVHVVLRAGCSPDMYERHLDFALWDLEVRLGLAAPEITVEVLPAEVAPVVAQARRAPLAQALRRAG